MKAKFLIGMLVLTLVLAACAPQATVTAEPTAMPRPTTAPTMEPTMEPKSIIDIAASDARFSTLVSAVGAAVLVDTLKGAGPFTVFAPTNDAFAALPAGTLDSLLKPENKQQLTDILLYHVVPGKVMAADVAALNGKMADTALEGKQIAIKTDMGNVYLNDTVKVVTTDIEASNGVIHVIDAVLLPPTDETSASMEKKDIVDTAVADGRFKTLVAAVQAAGLVDTLKGAGPFTVFAPTDDAFAALPTGTLDSLLKPENKQQLIDILAYHVVAGKVMASDVTGLDKAPTVQGKDISVKVEDGKVILNDKVQVILTDIETSNGVIHVIDGVLLPPQ
jgi:transforming growth factor-beta-induced protein